MHWRRKQPAASDTGERKEEEDVEMIEHSEGQESEEIEEDDVEEVLTSDADAIEENELNKIEKMIKKREPSPPTSERSPISFAEQRRTVSFRFRSPSPVREITEQDEPDPDIRTRNEKAREELRQAYQRPYNSVYQRNKIHDRPEGELKCSVCNDLAPFFCGGCTATYCVECYPEREDYKCELGLLSCELPAKHIPQSVFDSVANETQAVSDMKAIFDDAYKEFGGYDNNPRRKYRLKHFQELRRKVQESQTTYWQRSLGCSTYRDK
eukprot:symbB.v1.2.034583.t1/scaffold4492.1/size38976/2